MSIFSFDIVVQIIKFCDVKTCNDMACVNRSFRANVCSMMSSNVLVSIWQDLILDKNLHDIVN